MIAEAQKRRRRSSAKEEVEDCKRLKAETMATTSEATTSDRRVETEVRILKSLIPGLSEERHIGEVGLPFQLTWTEGYVVLSAAAPVDFSFIAMTTKVHQHFFFQLCFSLLPCSWS